MSSIVLDANTANVALARRFVRERVHASVPDEVSEDLQLMVSELFTNVVEHGDADRVGIEISLSPGRATVCVDSADVADAAGDVGPAEGWEVADESEITGRGLGIVRQLADFVRVERTPGRFTVTVIRTFGPVGA